MERKINSIRTSNEGREIAVFEEENLALRRELQEARASRTLAENHAAKCVNFAVSRSVTPVTFDTPCITSTPVRTALTDTRFLLPAIPSTSHTISTSSVLCSRSGEVADLQPVSEDQCQNSATDSETVSREDSKVENALKRAEMFLASCHTAVTCTNNDVTSYIDIWKKVSNGNSGYQFVDTGTVCDILSNCKMEFDDYSRFRAKEARYAMLERVGRGNGGIIKSTITEEEENMKVSLTGIPEKPTDDQPSELYEAEISEYINQSAIKKKDGANDLELSQVLEEQKDLDKLSDALSKAEMLINHSNDYSFWQKLYKFRNQRGSFKKPRRKKRSLRKLFSETDESDEDSRQDSKTLADIVSPCSSGSNRDTTNEDGDCCPNDDCTNRAITDVPEVVVIGGGSIVPKDLCSMRTLTSRTQTAPSRATYTTAYI